MQSRPSCAQHGRTLCFAGALKDPVVFQASPVLSARVEYVLADSMGETVGLLALWVTLPVLSNETKFGSAGGTSRSLITVGSLKALA